MRYVLPDTLAQVRAAGRRASSPCGVGAAVWMDVTENDRDGLRLRMMVTDTIHGFDSFDVGLPRASSVAPEVVEDRVEHLAGSYPIETRMRDLVAAAQERMPSFPELWLDGEAT
jgi:hypothetical protein